MPRLAKIPLGKFLDSDVHESLCNPPHKKLQIREVL